MTEKSQKFECIKSFNAVLYRIFLLRSQQVFFITCHHSSSVHLVAMQVTQHALQSGDEVTAVLAFETFLDLLEVPASWVGAFFPALVKLSVETASNTQLELNTREQALQVQLCNNLIFPPQAT